MRTIKFFLCVVSACVLVVSAQAQNVLSKKMYKSYRGLVMAGYQGWHNAQGDGANRGWYHYTRKGQFKPGFTNVDLWPDVSEYEKTYPTAFKFDDGTVARVYSDHDYSTVDTHFRWMQEYGLDGVFMQRFITEIRHKSGLNHFNKVLSSAMTAANKYSRSICVMYDLSGMRKDEDSVIIADMKKVAKEYNLFHHKKNPSYLYHNGKPLVTVWGVGFNDHRAYGLTEATRIVNSFKKMGFSVMLGVPTNWHKLEKDCVNDTALHDLIRKCDVVMPWFVGRYDENSFPRFHQLIKDDMAWADANKVDYAPLCYAGFSWSNMQYPNESKFSAPRNKGSFYKKQLDFAIDNGAKMLYIAMFDEIDEGTAIFKIANKVPTAVPGSTFVPLEDGLPSDFYLKMTGDAARKLREHQGIKE